MQFHILKYMTVFTNFTKKKSVMISPKFENFGDIMFLVAPPSPPTHANACTGHNFVTNTPIKFIFAIDKAAETAAQPKT